jgi:hypothetical protein
VTTSSPARQRRHHRRRRPDAAASSSGSDDLIGGRATRSAGGKTTSEPAMTSLSRAGWTSEWRQGRRPLQVLRRPEDFRGTIWNFNTRDGGQRRGRRGLLFAASTTCRQPRSARSTADRDDDRRDGKDLVCSATTSTRTKRRQILHPGCLRAARHLLPREPGHFDTDQANRCDTAVVEPACGQDVRVAQIRSADVPSFRAQAFPPSPRSPSTDIAALVVWQHLRREMRALTPANMTRPNSSLT